MGRETRHLWIGNLPDNTDESAARSYFSQYGDIDKVEFLSDKNSPSGVTAVLSFLSIQAANKIKKISHKMGNNQLTAKYHDFSSTIEDGRDGPPKDIRKRDHTTRKRSHSAGPPGASPRVRGLKRKVSMSNPAPDLVFDARKRVILCHRIPENHSSSTITSGFYHEFKQLGKIKVLWLHEHARVKTVVVMYHDSEDAHVAYQELHGKLQFGKPMDLELVKDKDAYTHYPNDDDTRGPFVANRKQEQHAGRASHRDDDFGPVQAPVYPDEPVTDEGASSTLFVGNLSGNVRYKDLMNIFRKYGEIECIDMKESDKGFPYAFVRFFELRAAFLAKKYLNEEFLDERRMKIGYGKGCHTNTVMAMEIDRACPESKVEREFSKYGRLVRLTFNPSLGSALLTYDNIESSGLAIENMRGRCVGRSGRVKVDFANFDECEEFYHNLERCKASQQLMRFHMDLLSQPVEQERIPRGGGNRSRYNDDFNSNARVEERRLDTYPSRYIEPLDIGPTIERKRDNRENQRDVRPVYNNTSRNVRDITPPSPPRAMKPRYTRHNSDSRDNRNSRPTRPDLDWKGKEKRVVSRDDRGDRRINSRDRDRRDDKSKIQSVAYRYNSEERQMARNTRSRNSSEDREEHISFNRPPPKRTISDKKHRSVSPEMSHHMSSDKYSKYNDVKIKNETREPRKDDRRDDYPKLRPRGPGLMDNDWDKKQISPVVGVGPRNKSSVKRDDREEKRPRKHSVRASPHNNNRELRKKIKTEKKEEKRKKDKRRHDLSEEEELINSIIAMRREDRLKAARTNRKRTKPVKKQPKKLVKSDTSDDTTEESSSSSAASTEDEEIDVGQVETEPPKHPSPDTALERIAKIISDSTNGQVSDGKVQLNPPQTDCYSPGHDEASPNNGASFKELPIMNTVMPGVQLPPVNTTGFVPSLPLNQSTELLALLRKYPIMWNGSLALKNDQAAVQFHFLSGSANIAEGAINALPNLGPGPMRIAQRMRLEPSQIDGVQKRMQHDGQWCMMLALPHGTDPISVSTQTTTLQHGFISYLQNKQAAGIINLPVPNQPSPFVLHIFPPCDFTQTHMRQFCPELIEGTDDCGYLLIVIATV